jgi:rhodanese-related sulfurtransferase
MPEVNPQRAQELIESDAQVIDVRTEAEYEAGHIAGARHVPLADVAGDVDALDRQRVLILYCRSGERSGIAADAFAESGWDAYSVEDGLLRWVEEGLPLEPEDGTVAENPNLPPR